MEQIFSKNGDLTEQIFGKTAIWQIFIAPKFGFKFWSGQPLIPVYQIIHSFKRAYFTPPSDRDSHNSHYLIDLIFNKFMILNCGSYKFVQIQVHNVRKLLNLETSTKR